MCAWVVDLHAADLRDLPVSGVLGVDMVHQALAGGLVVANDPGFSGLVVDRVERRVPSKEDDRIAWPLEAWFASSGRRPKRVVGDVADPLGHVDEVVVAEAQLLEVHHFPDVPRQALQALARQAARAHYAEACLLAKKDSDSES